MTQTGASPFAAFLGPMPDWRTSEVCAADGTTLVVRAVGEGPPLLVVHGGMSCAQFYAAVTVPLSARRTMHLLERRNYGISMDGPKPNTFDMEAADVHRVIASIGGACDLFGHSAGALVSLRALAANGNSIRRCVLYEPPIDSAGDFVVPIMAAYRRRVAAGDWRTAMRSVLIDVTGSTRAEAEPLLRMFSALDAVALSRLLFAVEAELEALAVFRMPDAGAQRVPMLLIGGEASAEHPLKASTAKLRRLCPESRYVELKGEGHTANMTSPLALAGALVEFFA